MNSHDPDETLRSTDSLIGRELDGKYRILAPIGKGNMGVIYRALRLKLKDEVAIKVLLKKYVEDSAAIERFRREAQAAAGLHHENIVTVHDFGEARSQGVPAYIVMELLKGTSLRDLLQREGRFEPVRAISLMCSICAGVNIAHRNKIVHRDLKPANVMVLAMDDDRTRERVKVVDFGIAKLRDPTGAPLLTQPGEVLGTPYYMSPEQCRGEESLDVRSDVYSLGAMLYEMLDGKPPFEGSNVPALISKHQYEPPPRFRKQLDIPPALEAVVMSALQKKAGARPQNAGELAGALQAAMSHLSDTQSHAKFWVLVSAMLIAMVIGALTLSGWFGKKNIYKFETVKLDASGKVAERHQEQARFFSENVGGVTLDMVEIPGGTFLIGSPDTEKDRRVDEGPQHSVAVSAFYMGKFEVTQAQWRVVSNLPRIGRDLVSDPSNFKGDDRPVEQVSWEDAGEFCARLSKATGREYRLPTEAEWEYACRAGTTTPFALGETITPELVNYDSNNPYGEALKGQQRKETTAVGHMGIANRFGLYDMHGNVWEWVQDNYHKGYRGTTNGRVEEQGDDPKHRILRGGSWNASGSYCRSAFRQSAPSDKRADIFGFRLACSIPK